MSEKIGLGAGVPFVDGLSASGLVAVGAFWADGVVSLPPLAGNYIPTLALTDNGPGDQGSGETATGASITVVHRLSAPISIVGWSITVYYRGALTLDYSYWDGFAWVPFVNLGPSPGSSPSYLVATYSGFFSGVPAASVFRLVATETNTTDGPIRVTDSHPS